MRMVLGINANDLFAWFLFINAVIHVLFDILLCILLLDQSNELVASNDSSIVSSN